MGRPSPLKQNFDPLTRRTKGPRPTSQPAGGQGKDALHIDQVMGLLRAIGIDAELMEHIQRRIEVKTKAPEKPLSEIVAELEAKERRAANHSIHLQRVVDFKRQQLAQAETRLQAHLEEHEQIKEQLEIAHAKQVRHISRNPYDPDSAEESACEIQEDSGGEEDEEEDEQVMLKNPLRPRLFVGNDGGSGESDGWTLVPKRAKVMKAKLEESYKGVKKDGPFAPVSPGKKMSPSFKKEMFSFSRSPLGFSQVPDARVHREWNAVAVLWRLLVALLMEVHLFLVFIVSFFPRAALRQLTQLLDLKADLLVDQRFVLHLRCRLVEMLGERFLAFR